MNQVIKGDCVRKGIFPSILIYKEIIWMLFFRNIIYIVFIILYIYVYIIISIL